MQPAGILRGIATGNRQINCCEARHRCLPAAAASMGTPTERQAVAEGISRGDPQEGDRGSVGKEWEKEGETQQRQAEAEVDMDEESELRACALEAQKVSKKAEAAFDPGSPEDSDVIVIDSDSEDGPPAQSKRDRLKGALAQLSQILSNSAVKPETMREALEETMEAGMSQLEWLDAAQLWLAKREEMNLEIEGFRAAMAASLRESEEQSVPLKDRDDATLQERFKNSSFLQKVGWIPHMTVRSVLVDFLELEEKCRRWWSGIDPFFEELGTELLCIASASVPTSADCLQPSKQIPASKHDRSHKAKVCPLGSIAQASSVASSTGKLRSQRASCSGRPRKRRACGSPRPLQDSGCQSEANLSDTGNVPVPPHTSTPATTPGCSNGQRAHASAAHGLNIISGETAQKISAVLTQKMEAIRSEFIQPSNNIPKIFLPYQKSEVLEIAE
mmetsp:Transcript_6774/g.18989  ORF Transcript_6774/g.18989 Transcript_6774/m.18989 type:complete len:446 (+) Transcript_6774:74-1411(+)